MSESVPIKQWSEEDRPREKLEKHGAGHLTDSELFAILIATGSGKSSALDLARAVLRAGDGDLYKVAKLSVKELTKIKGIGPAKAITLAAAFELGRRRGMLEAVTYQPQKFNDPEVVFDLLVNEVRGLTKEYAWILVLDTSLSLIKKERIAEGGKQAILIDPKVVFARILELGGTAFILIHNHPSNNLAPSQADMDITQLLQKGGKVLQIRLCDHIIVTEFGFYSFAQNGHLS